MTKRPRRRSFLAGGVVVLAVAAVFGIASAVGESGESPPAISETLPIEARPAVTATASERKTIEMSTALPARVGITEKSYSSAREVFSSSEAGRMLFVPGSQGACLVMSSGISCGNPTDETLPFLSMFTSDGDSPYKIGGGVTPADVTAVIFEDSKGQKFVLPVESGVVVVDASDRLTRDAKYVGFSRDH